MKIRCTKIQVIHIFYSLITHYQRTYCWPTRKKILKLLEDRYKTKVSYRCLDQHIAELNDGKYIKSFKRTKRNDDGTLYNLPSNRSLTWKSIYFLISMGIKVPRWLMKWMKTGERPAFSRPPQYKTIPSKITEPTERRDRASPESKPERIKFDLDDPTPQES